METYLDTLEMGAGVCDVSLLWSGQIMGVFFGLVVLFSLVELIDLGNISRLLPTSQSHIASALGF